MNGETFNMSELMRLGMLKFNIPMQLWPYFKYSLFQPLNYIAFILIKGLLDHLFLSHSLLLNGLGN